MGDAGVETQYRLLNVPLSKHTIEYPKARGNALFFFVMVLKSTRDEVSALTLKLIFLVLALILCIFFAYPDFAPDAFSFSPR